VGSLVRGPRRYRARQVDLDRIVALKVLHGGTGAGSALIERFLREARAAARLDHPGIVRVYEVGEEEGVRFFAMELVAGENLLSRVRRSAPPLRERVRWVRDAAVALHYAHEQGLVHRDVKPANLLVDDRGVVKVADFGLARDASTSAGLTISGQVMGTPQYMAPEQARGEWTLVGRRADVYSLGATLYELICGAPPVDAADLPSLLQKVAQGEVVPLRARAPQVPRDLETIVSKTLDADPARRYPTALELSEDLDRFLRFEAIRARPSTFWERTSRKLRRNVGRVALAVGAVALVAGGAAFVWSQRSKANRAESLAHAQQEHLAAMAIYAQAGCAEFILAHGGAAAQEKLLLEAIAKSPSFAEPCLRLGLLCEWTGRTEDAFRWYREAIHRAPALAQANARIAVLDLLVSQEAPASDPRRDEANRILEDLAKTAGEDPYARYAILYAEALRGGGDLARVVSDLEALGDRIPDARVLLSGVRGAPFHPTCPPVFPGVASVRDLGAAYEQVSKVVAGDPLHLQARMALGLLRAELGDLFDAESDFRAAATCAPGWARPHYELGRVALSLGRLPDAIAELEAATEAAPSTLHLNALAVVLAISRRYEEALAALDRSLAADPANDDALILHAMALLGLGRREQANAETRRWMKGSPAYAVLLREADKDLSKGAVRLVLEAIRRSLQEFQDVLFLSPQTKLAVKGTIPMVLKVDKLREMMQRYEEANRAHPAMRDLLLNLSRFEKDNPDLGEFLKFLREELKLKIDLHLAVTLMEFWFKLAHDEQLTRLSTLLTPKDYLWRAGIRYRTGDLKGAEADLEEAARIGTNDPRAQYGLATIWALRGDPQRCADCLWKARQYGWQNFAWIAEDADFEKVRDVPEVKAAAAGN